MDRIWKEIATLTGLSKRVTQVWFQNSRARQKKYMNKSRSGPVQCINGNGGQNLNVTRSGSTSSDWARSWIRTGLEQQLLLDHVQHALLRGRVTTRACVCVNEEAAINFHSIKYLKLDNYCDIDCNCNFIWNLKIGTFSKIWIQSSERVRARKQKCWWRVIGFVIERDFAATASSYARSLLRTGTRTELRTQNKTRNRTQNSEQNFRTETRYRKDVQMYPEGDTRFLFLLGHTLSTVPFTLIDGKVDKF